MCGIAGVVEAEGPPSRELLERMGQAITHRGPDDGRVETFGRAGFSFRRLSIIDLAGGAQPISNETGRIHVMANGEIYNYLDLRLELESLGHRLKTHSDVETIVHGYEQWGDEVAKHLHGMFAFAIWDEDRQRLRSGAIGSGRNPSSTRKRREGSPSAANSPRCSRTGAYRGTWTVAPSTTT